MKVLFYHLVPFAWAHGGLQIQIFRTSMPSKRWG